MSNSIVIEYKSSVLVDAGWRSVYIKAKAVKISPKMAEVVNVLEIDGEIPSGYVSRTGAKRQRYNSDSIAKREVGSRKRISSCSVL
jgi:hypothetical protein